MTGTNLSGLVGQSVTRVEDDRLLIGNGRYVADLEPEGVLHAAFLRSPLAHARITSIDVTAARRAPGVTAVYTGADMERLTHAFPPLMMSAGLYTPVFHALSAERVRHVGDPVALVIAASRHLAEDALELVEIDYAPLDTISSIAEAFQPGRPLLWDKAGSNVVYDHSDSYGDVDAVFAAADRVFTERLSCQRQSNQPMETRGSVIEIDPDTRQLTVHSSTQSSHMLRWATAALTGKEPLRASLKRLASNKERRAAFGAGAKQFVGEHGDSLKGQDNAGPKDQFKRDKSLPKHIAGIGVALLAKDTYPIVKAQDIGGGFGSKGAVAREDIALAAAAIDLGRPLKWIEDRSENLLDGGHAREEDLTVSIAVDNDGTLRGLRVDLVFDQGAYPAFPITAASFAGMMRVLFPGSYRWDAFEIRARAVATNKGRYVAYRGPWANETWARERMLDIVARALGMRPTDLRLKNMMGDDDMAPAMITGPTLDATMSTKRTLERAIELIDIDAFRAEQARALAAGRYLGLGIASYHEPAPGPPNYWSSVSPGSDMLMGEEAWTAVMPDGSIEVYTSQMPHGQSHETTYGQIVADELGVSRHDVKIVYGNTNRTPFSVIGTGGSRGGPMGGGAVKYSSRDVRQQLVDQAAKMLEAAPADIEIVDGNVHVAGVPSRGLTVADVAASAVSERGTVPGRGAEGKGQEAAFSASIVYRGKGDGGWSVATHACIVEVDLETGLVGFPRYLVVEDCGPIINPAIVDGQVRGGVAQGIGAVLYEKAAYDDDANMQAATYMDYLLPTAMEIPDIEIHHLETISPGGENDFRGVGEGGMIGAPAAITNAIEDALAPFGARVDTQYNPPSRILELAGIIPRR